MKKYAYFWRMTNTRINLLSVFGFESFNLKDLANPNLNKLSKSTIFRITHSKERDHFYEIDQIEDLIKRLT